MRLYQDTSLHLRNRRMDILRAIAIVLVVWGHNLPHPGFTWFDRCFPFFHMVHAVATGLLGAGQLGGSTTGDMVLLVWLFLK